MRANCLLADAVCEAEPSSPVISESASSTDTGVPMSVVVLLSALSQGGVEDCAWPLASTRVLIPSARTRLSEAGRRAAVGEAVGGPGCPQHSSSSPRRPSRRYRTYAAAAGHRPADQVGGPDVLVKRGMAERGHVHVGVGGEECGLPGAGLLQLRQPGRGRLARLFRGPPGALGAAPGGVVPRHHRHVGQQRRVDVPGQVVGLRPGGAGVEQRGKPPAGGDSTRKARTWRASVRTRPAAECRRAARSMSCGAARAWWRDPSRAAGSGWWR